MGETRGIALDQVHEGKTHRVANVERFNKTYLTMVPACNVFEAILDVNALTTDG